MKITLYTLICMIMFFSCHTKEEPHYTIEGNISHLENKKIYIISYLDDDINTTEIDSLTCSEEGHFIFKGKSKNLSRIIINMEEGSVWTSV
ncbi:hypothetical protein AwDysgo_09520 [Bacteroidales bacterium]|nr:hypothetical protein AwDysgo_09520 [Bacteroidales bacterium]